MADLRCPSCDQIDLVQRVAAIYAAGTTTTSIRGTTSLPVTTQGYGGTASVSGQQMSQTNLAASLKPPQSGCPLGCIIFLVILALPILLFGAVGLVALSLGLIHSTAADAEIGLVGAGAIFVLGLIVLLLAIWGRTIRAGYKTKLERWQRSWYCQRCHLVFQ